MAYGCDYGAGQRLLLDNPGAQTRITLASSSAGQQQQATQSFQTGAWTAPPQVLQAADRLVVKLTTAAGEILIQMQGSSLRQVNAEAIGSADIGSAQPLPLQQIASPASMQPMQPMRPMQMGNMSMSLNPMEMRMGDMQLQMGKAASSTRFCSQCGTRVKPDDRFCSQCGTQMEPA